MRVLFQLLSVLALAATIVPSVLYLTNRLELDLVKLAMHLATVLWFAATPLWMGRKRARAEQPAEQAVIP